MIDDHFLDQRKANVKVKDLIESLKVYPNLGGLILPDKREDQRSKVLKTYTREQIEQLANIIVWTLIDRFTGEDS